MWLTMNDGTDEVACRWHVPLVPPSPGRTVPWVGFIFTAELKFHFPR